MGVSLLSFALIAWWFGRSVSQQQVAANINALHAGDLDTTVFGGSGAFGEILVSNLGACALLYSGVMTLALTTVLGITVLGAYLGFTGSLIVQTLGASELFARVGSYVFIELAGVVVAAAAGFLPLAHLVSHATRNREATMASLFSAYTHGLRGSLLLAAASAVLIVLAAGIETIAYSITNAHR
ncbi:stage II sporulation protein M [Humidisolicoccus flavus]|uniref:stage II sporulation protein M n=1 Tax=Humidisolicoccus flavus TaxID=3111414 RepID=UPI0032439827